ncbi:Os06g0689800 [Oryza sativa Japonica Group]|uniref:Os06g0689800 protein n=2 Tax=Oryza sativa subsp. japonica TaxID=39947 RepID=B9FQL2_ORYSJ|nr:hypothetical protein OsJ_22439 [Oryza sativa Japonica Group]BAS99225.1 Os06g0689800 [Oryza sativa Japonica Group]
MRSPVLPPPHLVSCHHLSSLLSTYAVQEDSPCTDLASRASPPASRLSGPSVRWASTAPATAVAEAEAEALGDGDGARGEALRDDETTAVEAEVEATA